MRSPVFGEGSQFIIQITSGEQYMLCVRDTLRIELCAQPLFFFSGMLEVVLHDVTVENEYGSQVFLFRCQSQIVRSCRTVG